MDRRVFLSTSVSAAIAGCTWSGDDNGSTDETNNTNDRDQGGSEGDDTEDGEQEKSEEVIAWKTDIPEPNAGPLAYDNQIYLPIRNYIVAYDGLTGEGLWEGEVFREANGAPFITKDRAYVPSRQGGVYGFTHSGTLDWRVERDEFAPPTPIVTDKMVFAGGRTISAMSIEEEEIIWEVSVSHSSFGFTADSNAVYFASREREGISEMHVFKAVDAATGEQLWSVEHEYTGNEYSQPQVVGDEILVRRDSNLIALDKVTGDEMWREQFDNSFGYGVVGEPESDDTRLYVRERDTGGRRDTIYALKYASRKQEWSYSRDFELLGGPIVTEESLFVTGSDNEITQLDPTDGSVSSRVQLDRNIGAATVTNEMIVVLTGRNEILGVRRDIF